MKTQRKKSRRNLFMSATLMCVFIIFTFQFDASHIHWMWEGEIQVPVILGISAFVFALFWFAEQKKI